MKYENNTKLKKNNLYKNRLNSRMINSTKITMKHKHNDKFSAN